MNYNPNIPTYYSLLKLNPLLQRRTSSEVEHLISTMIELGYEWNEEEMFFINHEINLSIRTQGLDTFTAKSFREFHEDKIDEINANPTLYHKAGTAKLQLKKVSSFFSKGLIILLTLGWFILSPSTITYTSIIIIIIWLFFLIRSNRYNSLQNKIRDQIFHKNYQKRNGLKVNE